ncbi:MAG: patatin-like phospholipase family protein [Alphaproteobacteria bacterium]|nr:patatin-like phospholipase family protein [Alphaproteobacteria bacterium]
MHNKIGLLNIACLVYGLTISTTAVAAGSHQGSSPPEINILQSPRQEVTFRVVSDANSPRRLILSPTLSGGTRSIKPMDANILDRGVASAKNIAQSATAFNLAYNLGTADSSYRRTLPTILPYQKSPHFDRESNPPPVEQFSLSADDNTPPSDLNAIRINLSEADAKNVSGGNLTVKFSDDVILQQSAPPSSKHSRQSSNVPTPLSVSGSERNTAFTDLQHAPPTILRILSIDGGGIKGIIPATLLEHLEKKLGGPISNYFDIIAGTSIGGIFALAAATPKRISRAASPTAQNNNLFNMGDLSHICSNYGSVVFDPACSCFGLCKPQYNTDKYEDFLKELFGDRTLRSGLLSDVVVVAYDTKHARPVLFNTFDIPEDFYLRDIARATSAAPTYFPPATVRGVPRQSDGSMRSSDSESPNRANQYTFVDGGLIANNPMLDVIALAQKYYGAVDRYTVVSLGTGERFDPIPDADIMNAGTVGMVRHIINLSINGRTELTHEGVKALLPEIPLPTGQTFRQYYRFQPRLDTSRDTMDNTDSTHVDYLESIARDFYSERESQFDQLVSELRLPRTKPVRL